MSAKSSSKKKMYTIDFGPGQKFGPVSRREAVRIAAKKLEEVVRNRARRKSGRR